MPNRTVFLIDGFNIYHSIVDLERERGLRAKWLDYYSLCRSLLSALGKDFSLQGVHYFTALAHHLGKPDVVSRHEDYIRCLEDTGVVAERGKFKARNIVCKVCGQSFTRNEEKGTDVAVAARLLDLFCQDLCDCVVLVTGDTDLVPAFRTARRLFPDKKLVFAFPYARRNVELANIAPGSFRISYQNYVKYQLPSPYRLADGTVIGKPSSW